MYCIAIKCVLTTGNHVTMVAVSKSVGLALKAAEELANIGISAEVCD